MKSADELELSSFRYGGVRMTGFSLLKRDLTSIYEYLGHVDKSTNFNNRPSQQLPPLTVRVRASCNGDCRS